MAKLRFPHKFVNLETLDYEGECPEKKFFNPTDFSDNEEYLFFKKQNSPFFLKKKAIEYCIRDVVILRKILLIFFKIIHGYGSNLIAHCFSFSAISYKIFIQKYDKWGIAKNKNSAFTHNYIKNAYFGGRTEVFGNPTNKIVHYFDFEGMYGQCMKEKFPIGAPIFEKSNLNVNKIGFHTIKFQCNAELPMLPFRSDKLFFPTGEMIGTY
jgi:hypothetical protein